MNIYLAGSIIILAIRLSRVVLTDYSTFGRFDVFYNQFYRELYEGIDIENCHIQDLPTVTKSTMMDNFDRLVTDKRLNLSEIRNWLSDEKNQSKFYLEEFAPFLTAGSTGENAMVVYNRRSLDRVMAKIQARFPFDRQISIYRQVKTAASHLMGARARVAFLSVPRGNFFALVRHRPSVQRLVANRKLISVFDPIDRIVEQLNEFQPDRMISKYYLI